jgi:hypothetical protein
LVLHGFPGEGIFSVLNDCWRLAQIAGFARRTRFFLLRRQKKEPKEKATLRLPNSRKKRFGQELPELAIR